MKRFMSYLGDLLLATLGVLMLCAVVGCVGSDGAALYQCERCRSAGIQPNGLMSPQLDMECGCGGSLNYRRQLTDGEWKQRNRDGRLIIYEGDI